MTPRRNIFADHGEKSILHAVQMARIFPDSKTFVDMKLLKNPNLIQRQFEDLQRDYDPTIPRAELLKFVEENFTLENQMEEHEPADWIPCPKVLASVKDPEYKDFADKLNRRWKTLCRKIKDEVESEQENYTLIYLPNPVVVPGGRFREIYYWDSFWIIRGLLLCDMFDTVKGMLRNFALLIQKFGKIPNGGRTYYLNRSQPPLFIQMVEQYVDVTGDTAFIREIYPQMVREFDYWLKEHSVKVLKNGVEHEMFRFNCEEAGPRPESYVEDFELAQEMHRGDPENLARFYWEMKTGAETGWDYSSRWMIDGDDLSDTKARSIIPVDLNSFIAKNAQILAGYAQHLGEENDASKYREHGQKLCEAIDAVLWDDRDGVWYDFDIINNCQRNHFTPSNLVPLWTGTYRDKKAKAQSAVNYLIRQELMENNPGGVPTTFVKSGQQWDFPNCWPPLEHMLVHGLLNTGILEAEQLAAEIAERRVQGAYLNFAAKDENMFEKYNATSLMGVGGGGEYEIQIGFGWTNGVVLDFLNEFGSKLTVPKRALSQREL